MPIDNELLEILVCPETRQPVTLASSDVLASLNSEIEARRLRNRGGATAPEDATREVRRITGNLETELRAELDLTRRMLAEVAGGSGITPEAIMEGQLWRDVEA